MPNNVLYYTNLVRLCLVTGDYVQKRELLNDLRNGDPTSPDSVITLAKYYKGDINDLARVYKRVYTETADAWTSVKEILVAGDRYSKEDAEVFSRQLAKKTSDSDFREKVRGWARAELAKEQKGKESTLYDMGDFLERYQKLLLRRQSS